MVNQFSDDLLYVAPQEKCVRNKWTMKRQPDTKSRQFDIVQSTYIYISLIDQIKACFLRDDFKDNKDHVCVPGVYKQFCCGQLFKKSEFYNSEGNMLQIIIGFDDFCIVDPLGSAAATHKVTAIYAKIGNLPGHLQSKINNIMLLSLLFSDELNSAETDFNEAWELVKHDVKQIESQGIDIGGIIIKGSISFLCHDNLGGNIGLLLAKGFNATYYCRICLCSHEECQNMTVEISHKIRTKESYENDLKTIAESEKVAYKDTHGVERFCILNELKYFHIFENLSADIMHDICEGAIPFILKRLFQLIIKKKICSEDVLYKKFSVHDYGNPTNTPTPINLNRACLGQTAAKSLCLFLNTPLVLYDTRDEKILKDIWPCISSLIEIIQIVFSTEITSDDLDRLQSLVDFHLSGIKNCGFKLIPKHHFMTHYKHIIEQMGPLFYMSMWSFEHKHQTLKAFAGDCFNFSNILKTMAIKHQQMISKQGLKLHNFTKYGPCKDLDEKFMEEHARQLALFGSTRSIREVSWFQCNMFQYKTGSVLVYDNMVVRICKILLIDENPYFLRVNLRMIGIDAFAQAAAVMPAETTEPSLFHFDSLNHKNVYYTSEIENRTLITFADLSFRRIIPRM